jgi:hypothetical protein
MAQAWKTVKVFISSTFRDMQAERDHLVRFVFPRLREQLLARRIHLVDVDLRWGVTSEQLRWPWRTGPQSRRALGTWKRPAVTWGAQQRLVA